MRIVFLGMSGPFSWPPLETLLAGGVEVSAVILPAASPSLDPLPRRVEPARPALSALPVINPYLHPNIIHLAWAQDIPVWEIGSLSDSSTLALLAALKPDLIVVACFPFILPAAVLHLPRYGCLNLHPSLLPAYRGPIPIFWMARQGERQAGVTLHFMNEGVDSGDIVAQTAFDWPEGISGTELEQRCAAEGGALLLEAVRQLAEIGQLPRRPQSTTDSSYFSWPTEKDLVIPTNWDAPRAFNFIRAAVGWPLVIATDERYFPAGRALGYEVELMLDQPYRFEEGEVWIQFQPGVLRIE
jgi:methionyl-tRNA formyltransferase